MTATPLSVADRQASDACSSRRSGLVVANPTARTITPRLVAEVIDELKQTIGCVSTHSTSGATETASLVETAVVTSAELGRDLTVVSVGGDGSLRDAAEAIARGTGVWPDGHAPPNGPSLFVVPAGSGNSVYRALWGERPWRESLREAMATAAPPAAPIDLVHVRETGRASVLGVNVGLGGRVAELLRGATEVDDAQRWAAVGGALNDARSYPGRVTVDSDVIFEGSISQVTVGGGRHFMGGGFELLPRADLRDGLLDVSVISELDDEGLAEIAPLIADGGHLDHPKVTYAQGRTVILERTDGRALCFEHDGDAQPALGVLTLEVAPSAIAMHGADRRGLDTSGAGL
jgi:diacylglycerol kinase (ATP)